MDAAALTVWEGHLAALGQRIAAAVAGLDAAHGDAVRPTSIGLGDASWALDEACETVVATWFEERAREGPLSLLTEHHGWRHRGPDGEGGWRELDGFAHGGPRLACDPVDGTRHLLLRHRPAWSLIALAGPGPDQPRQRDVLLAHAEELVERVGSRGRALGARRGEGAWVKHGRGKEALRADADDRLDHGFVTFFAFHPAQRPAIASLADEVTRLWEERLGCAREHCWQDDYVCSGGLLLNAALGAQRVVVDARSLLAETASLPGGTCHAYDLAAAVLILEEAGGSVHSVSGGPFDQPLDATSPVGFLAFANPGTAERALPAILECLEPWSRPRSGNS